MVETPETGGASRLKRFSTLRMMTRDRTAVAGAIIFAAVIALALLAPYVAPADPLDQSMANRLRPPGTGIHILGTDDFGRDVLSRIIWGARVSVTVGIASVLLGMVIGIPLGVLGGFLEGRVDAAVVRLTDVLMAVPDTVLALVIVTLLGSGVDKLIWAIALTLAPRFIRLARAPTLSIREREFVEAGRALGANNLYLMAKYIFPNIFGQIAAMGALFMGVAIRSEANLSFLGMGVQPPMPSWGGMIRDGLNVVGTAPWLAIYPGLAVFITILALNMFGDGLRDAMDPKTGAASRQR